MSNVLISFPYIFPNGETINMANVTFVGTVKDSQSTLGIDASGFITVNKDSGSSTIPVTSDLSGSFSATEVFEDSGDYTAFATFSKSGYKDAVSPTVTFTVQLRDMVVTLDVTVGTV